jgi:hypothetical protein
VIYLRIGTGQRMHKALVVVSVMYVTLPWGIWNALPASFHHDLDSWPYGKTFSSFLLIRVLSLERFAEGGDG